MATFKRLRNTRVASVDTAVVVLPLDLVISPQPADVGALTPAARQVWHELRREFFRAIAGQRDFDPRRLFEFSTAEELDEWRAARRAWAAKHFQADTRVIV